MNFKTGVTGFIYTFARGSVTVMRMVVGPYRVSR